MTDRLTGVEVQAEMLEVQAELLAEARRVRKSVDGIRTMLTVWFVLALLGALVAAVLLSS